MKEELKKQEKIVKGETIEKCLVITPKNKMMIEEFLSWLKGAVCDKRFYNYKLYLYKFADLIECDFDELNVIGRDGKISKRSKELMRRAATAIHSSDFSKNSVNMMITAIKVAFRHWYGDDEDNPPALKLLKSKKIKGPKKERQIFSEEDIMEMLKQITNPMWKFFVAFMGLDCGARAYELRTLKWNKLEKDDYSYYFWIKNAKDSGNTESRPARIIKAAPYFNEWKKLERLKNTTKPKLSGPDDYVFQDQYGKPLSEAAICMFFRRLRNLMGYEEFTSLSLRRSYITRKQREGIHPAKIQLIVGHKVGGKTIAGYTFLDDKDALDAQLEVGGIKRREEIIKHYAPKICPSCNIENKHDAEMCIECQLPLVEEAFLKIRKEQTDRLERLEKAMFMQSKMLVNLIKNKDYAALKKLIGNMEDGL